MNRTVWLISLVVILLLAVLPSPLASNLFTAQPELLVSPGEVVQKARGSLNYRFISDPALRNKNLYDLNQMRFWRKVITMTQDSALVNVAENRQVLGKLATRNWNRLSETQQKSFRAVLRRKYQLDKDEQLYITPGKKEFYDLDNALPVIDRAIDVFIKQGVNPWYAQAILLIESPGRLQHSTVGAYGPFQLMEGVAREYGLIVNDEIDEREDLQKAGKAAAGLINNMCIPYARRLLRDQGIEFQEHDLWFRLLVLHMYHAGPGNVAPAVKLTEVKDGGMPLIQKLWNTSYGGFGNASQNYSQVALACLVEMEYMISQAHDIVEEKSTRIVPGDFYIRTYSREVEKILVENTQTE